MKKDVGMAKYFSKKYGNKGLAFNYQQSERKLCQDACQEQAAKINVVSEVRIQVFSIMHS